MRLRGLRRGKGEGNEISWCNSAWRGQAKARPSYPGGGGKKDKDLFQESLLANDVAEVPARGGDDNADAQIAGAESKCITEEIPCVVCAKLSRSLPKLGIDQHSARTDRLHRERESTIHLINQRFATRFHTQKISSRRYLISERQDERLRASPAKGLSNYCHISLILSTDEYPMETFKLSVSGTALSACFLVWRYKLRGGREGGSWRSPTRTRAQEMKCYDSASVRLRDALARALL